MHSKYQISFLKTSCFLLILLSFTGCEKMLLGPGPENSPEGNFDVLWKTIDEKYGLFPVSDLNWDSLYSVYRNQIDENTSPDQLWNLCCSLISHLGNGHVCLSEESTPNVRYYSPDSPDPAVFPPKRYDVIETYLENIGYTGENNVTYGRISNSSLGYIAIHSFGGAQNGRDWVRDLNAVVMELSDCEGIVIDVRSNGGGFTRNNLYASSLFIDHDILYYYSQRKTGPGHDDFGEKIAKYCYPHPDASLIYQGNIVVLTDRHTASGAECFTLVMNNMENVVQIGDTTMGAIGEVPSVEQLPNGWTLYLPCTLTTLADGSSPERIGIAPDIYLKNTNAGLDAGRDRMLERAIEYLEGE